MINSYKLSYSQHQNKGKFRGDVEKNMPTNKHSEIYLLQLENGMKLYNWNTCTKTRLIASLLPNCCSQDLFLQMPSLGLNSWEKNKFPILLASTIIYMRKEESYMGPFSRPIFFWILLH